MKYLFKVTVVSIYRHSTTAHFMKDLLTRKMSNLCMSLHMLYEDREARKKIENTKAIKAIMKLFCFWLRQGGASHKTMARHITTQSYSTTQSCRIIISVCIYYQVTSNNVPLVYFQ